MKRFLVLALVLAACKGNEGAPVSDKTATAPARNKLLDEATAGLPAGDKLMAEFTTPLGKITCELYPDAAPETVASFVGLARGLRAWKDPLAGKAEKKAPFFDGLAFHRVIPRFMIQGGDPLSRDYSRPDLGTGDPGYSLPDELRADLRFDRPGRLAMANSGPRTQSGGSQFFITEVPYPSLDGGYVIFGQCQEIEVIQAIARVPVNGEKPVEAVTMKVTIFKK
jgi:peptidyl-prolyl cis-trans isomerase A (cyclophilin A)